MGKRFNLRITNCKKDDQRDFRLKTTIDLSYHIFSQSTEVTASLYSSNITERIIIDLQVRTVLIL
jgi:hypothetical protein